MTKQDRLPAGWPHRVAFLGSHEPAVGTALAEMAANNVPARIWAHDHTVWKPEPAEITNRLGWLHAAGDMAEHIERLESLAESVRAGRYTDVLLLGMGGSSLAPEVFSQTFGPRPGNPHLAVLDSTDPGAVLAQAERLDPTRTVLIVSTKSGGTVETLSLFKSFYNWVSDALGAERAGQHFIAITDPGSRLADLAERHRFRATFLNDPSIGGRYSALSYFGLVPAALMGIDVRTLLERAMAMSRGCESGVTVEDNPGVWLGAILGEMAKAGRDKLTLVSSPEIAGFGDWVEQLIAESTGKEGTGILPVVGEPLGPPAVYGDDRLFVYLGLTGWPAQPAGGHVRRDHETLAALQVLEDAGHPALGMHLHDRYDIGAQFFLWEMAAAIAGHRLGINPFDQPDVESAKVRAREMVAAYRQQGVLPRSESAPLSADTLRRFVGQGEPGDYVALQAYLPPARETDAALHTLRVRLRAATRLATTVGYGPRFLHSTGQLHKGDAGNGLFIQLTADDPQDVPIPDEVGSPASSITFGVLKAAQALGDRQALLEAGRRVIRLHLGSEVIGGLTQLADGLP